MGRHDWFRKTTWTKSDEQDFFSRLGRSRGPSNRAQYLRIQAACLHQAGGAENLKAALSLLDMLLKDYPERGELALAYFQKAECYLALGHVNEALDHFRKSMKAERDFPNVMCGASVAFAWTVVECRLSELYGEALAGLPDYEDIPPFPIEAYRTNAIRALLAEERGDLDLARELANAALDQAVKKHSGYRYHPDFGLVTDTSNEIHSRLLRLADSKHKVPRLM